MTRKNGLNIRKSVEITAHLDILKTREILGENADNLSDEQLEELLQKMRSIVSLLRDYHEQVH